MKLLREGCFVIWYDGFELLLCGGYWVFVFGINCDMGDWLFYNLFGFDVCM